MGMAVAGTFASGVLSAVLSPRFYCRPTLFDKKGFEILGLSGLQGTIFTIVSLCISKAVGSYVEKNSSGTSKEKDNNRIVAILSTYAFCGILIAATAKTLTNRLGTPTEAFTNFAVSSVIGFLGVLYFY